MKRITNGSGWKAAALLAGLLGIYGHANAEPQKHADAEMQKPVAAGAPAASATPSRFITLGTGAGPLASVSRSQPANVLIVKDTPYLIDAGNGVMRQLAHAGINSYDVKKIFITHHHDDHNADVGTLVGFTWDGAQTKPIDIYGPPGTQTLLSGFFQSFSVNARIRIADRGSKISPEQMAVAHDITRGGLVYQDSNVKVTAVENCHYHPRPSDTTPEAARDKSFAYRFETADRVIVVTGDTGPCAALTDFSRNADILISEVMSMDATDKWLTERRRLSPEQREVFRRRNERDHFAPEEVGKLAAAAGVKMVVLTHVAPGDYAGPDDSIYTAGVKRFYSGPVIVAKDLMEF